MVLCFGCLVFVANTKRCLHYHLKKVGVTIEEDLCENRSYEKPVPKWMCAKECDKDEKVQRLFLWATTRQCEGPKSASSSLHVKNALSQSAHCFLLGHGVHAGGTVGSGWWETS